MREIIKYFSTLFHVHKWEMLSSNGGDIYFCVKCKKLKR